MRRLAVALTVACLLVPLIPSCAHGGDVGMIYVRSIPEGAEVFVGGESKGKAPVLVRGVAAGECRITLRMKGASDKLAVARVEPGRVAKVDVDMQPKPASLTVISEPLGATVTIDMIARGVTPLTIDGLTPGPHEITVDLAEHAVHRAKIALESGKTRVYEVDLTKGEVVPAAGSVDLKSFEKAVAEGKLGSIDHATLPVAARDALAALKTRRGMIVASLHKRRGERTTLLTKKKKYVGELIAVSNVAATIEYELRHHGRVLGKSKLAIPIDEIAWKQAEQLAGGWTELAGADVANAFLALARNDRDDFAFYLAEIPAGPVKEYLASRLEPKEAPVVEETKPEPRKTSLLDRGLVCYLTFDEGAGTVAKDSSGNGNDATIENCEWAKGVRGSAVKTLGHGSKIVVRSSPSLEPTSAITVAFFMQITYVGNKGGGFVFGKHVRLNQGYRMLINCWGRWPRWCPVGTDGHTHINFKHDVSYFTDGVWRHISCTYDSSTGNCAVYTNGKVSNKSIVPRKQINHTNDLYILSGHPQSETIVGSVDEFRIYDRALSNGEIAALAVGRR